MSGSDRLLLILHVGFAIFTLGPLTAATSATPRYIRRHDVAVLRYLTRITRIYGLGTLGIFLFGLLLAHDQFSKAWLSASMTLFIVALVLLLLIERDQRRAIHALQAAGVGAGQAKRSTPEIESADSDAVPNTGAEEPAPDAVPAKEQDADVAVASQQPLGDEIARVERGRIASFSGVVATIWLVILFLMIWYSR